MSQPISVSDFTSNAPEQIEHYAKKLAKSPRKQQLLAEIYRGKQSVKTVKELASRMQLSEKQVLNIGKPLADQHLFEATKVNGRTAYKKRPTIATVRDDILRLARNKSKLDAFPTKRKLAVKAKVTIQNVFRSPSPRLITIDEVDQFAAVKRIDGLPERLDPARLPEAMVKAGIGTLLNETDLAKDWGGESNDLFSTNVKLNGKRHAAAFAFKGPAKSGKLTPGKMGRNGDQIQRLFNSDAAQVFFVQYEGQIDQSVLDLMKNLAIAKSVLSAKQIWWGVIDKRDTYRLRVAYPHAFSSN